MSLQLSCLFSHVQLFETPRHQARLRSPWNFLGKNTGVDYGFLLQGVLLTQGMNPHLLSLLHWQVDDFATGSPRKPLVFSESFSFKQTCSQIIMSGCHVQGWDGGGD